MYRLLLIAVSIAAIPAAGCRGTGAMRTGRQAEESGDYLAAFNRYCDAARRNPDSNAACAGISRTRKPAAASLYGRAMAAKNADSQGDAWKFAMQTLIVQPDHAHAARLIRDLERTQNGETLALRRQWLRGNAGVLVVNQPKPDTGLADGSHELDDAFANRLPPDATDAEPPLSEPSPRPTTAPKPPTMPQPPSARPAALRAEPSFEDESVAREGYLLKTTLSRNDDRYPERIDTIDGIAVRLRKVTDDEQAEMDIYIGDNRYKRRQLLRAGEMLKVPGRTGQSYVLEVLLVRPTRQIVRFGLRHADSAGDP